MAPKKQWDPKRIVVSHRVSLPALRGIADAVHPRLDCAEILSTPQLPEPAEPWFCVAAVAWIKTEKQLEAWQAFHGPVVLVNRISSTPSFPQVLSDDRDVGRMAAEYFLARGFRHFVYAGDTGPYSAPRREGFVETLRHAGIEDVACSETGSADQVAAIRAMLARHGGERVALFAVNDWRAHAVIHHCWSQGLRLPEQVAALGVGNNSIPSVCSRLPISSVELSEYGIGLQAGELLVDLMNGKPAPREPVLVPPLRVITRESTDLYASRDPAIAQALGFIESNLQHSISVHDIAGAVRGKPSARTLQRRFKKEFGVRLVEILARMRVDRVESLLRVRDLSLKEIAALTGFAGPSHMSATFRKYQNITPREFRRKILSPTR